MAWSLSVDLGTTNTVAAVRYGDAVPVTLPLAGGGKLPSAVYLSGASVYVGSEAWKHATEDPVSFYPSPKRLLVETPADEMELLAPVFAAIYREVYRRALAECGPGEPESVVLTHPAAFSERAVGLLVRAAVMAGVDEGAVRTLPEPVAAAAHHFRGPNATGNMVIVDIGGGTCDTALVRFDSAGTPSVIFSDGDNMLGGRTLDGRMLGLVAEKLDGGSPSPETLAGLSVPDVLRCLVRAREQLSEIDRCAVDLGEPWGTVEVTRGQLESGISDDVARMVELAQRSVDAGGPVGRRADLFLTGGTALTPSVQGALTTLGVLHPVTEPFSAVCLGALEFCASRCSDRPHDGVDGVKNQPGWRERVDRHRRTGDQRGRRRVVLGAVLLAVLMVAGVTVSQMSGGEEHPSVVASPDTVAEDFDPSPVVPVHLAPDSPLWSAGKLTCKGGMQTAASVVAEIYGKVKEPTATGVHGVTSCRLGADGQVDLSLDTYRRHGFEMFIDYQRNIGTAPVQLTGALSHWYRFDSETLGWAAVALYVADAGWLVINVRDEAAAKTSIAERIAAALDPAIRIEES
ncbi:Hsp70 family protein [Corynebacterium neomassiliense]|uniref:Hsp70 family protein n=1 Tax=Corynebacterium neomassiliense TaxID=2079482 RepID=UPI001031DF5B|nr:Hsp70 family protein [Corynebacterium neomassiliense]